jgi:hypothetical protein
MRAGMAEVDRNVGGLRSTLVQVVRTSMTEADRRTEPRNVVAEVCAVITPAGGRTSGTLRDISPRGALIGIPADSAAGLAEGATGTLVLERRGGLRCGFTVRAVTEHGMHVELGRECEAPEWRRVVDEITGRAASRRAPAAA